MRETQKQKNRRRSKQAERILGILAVLTIVAAGVTGLQLEKSEIEPSLQQAYPSGVRFDQLDPGAFAVFADAAAEDLIGYVGTGEANGYGGPMRLAVGVNLNGDVVGLAVIKHRETPAWFDKVMGSGFVETLLQKNYLDPFQLDSDLDGVTSATYTSRAIADSVRIASRAVAENQLGLEAPPKPTTKIVFGIPEITLLALFAIGYFGKQSSFKYKNQLRWASLITGMVVLGFMYNSPLTLAYINKLLMGFWPEWQTNLYWYILIGGILFVFTVDNKNPYCQWFCPFGASQECMGVIGNAKVVSPGKHRVWMKWTLRTVVWFSIVVALLTRSPGLTSYEIFGTLFSLLGNNIQFILLGIVLVASIFIKRPWCTYLCPIGPVDAFIRMARKWVMEQWRKTKQKTKETTARSSS